MQIIKKCGCYYLGYGNLMNGTRPCLNLNDDSCVNLQIQQFSISNEECFNSCVLECDKVSYDLAVSSLTNPSIYAYNSLSDGDLLKYQNLLNQNISYELYKSLFVKITIYYKSFFDTQINELPKKTLVDLLSQIGGSLQLLISYSFFTFFELVEIFFLVTYAFCTKSSSMNILV